MQPTNDSNPDTNKPFRFTDKRQLEIYDFLKRLVGEGAAAFYKDACRIMEIKPPFGSITHLVGHMMREVETSMLGVLQGISEAIPKDTKNRHKLQVESILKALEINEDDPIAEAYLKVTSAGLHSLAHRDGLNAPRKIDDEFTKTWEDTNVVLHGILSRFETKYLNVFKVLDELLKKEEPSPDDIKTLKERIPSNFLTQEHFFGKLLSVKWLDQLAGAGFFKSPPTVEYNDEDGGMRHPTWPALIYLSKMADKSPSTIVSIIRKIKMNDNGNAKAGVMDVILNLPAENKKELTSLVIEWLSSGDQFFTHLKAIELIKKLCEEKNVESAFEISKCLLDIIKEDTTQTGRNPLKRPQTRINHWSYSKFALEEFSEVWKEKTYDSLMLVTDLLKKYSCIEDRDDKEDVFQDYSYISRPAIEITHHIHRGEVKDSLIDTLVNIATYHIEQNHLNLPQIIGEFEKRKWPIFRRIALFLLSKYPELMPEKTKEYLESTEHMHNPNYQREYALLADSASSILGDDTMEKIYKYIDEAEEAKKHIQKYEHDLEKGERYLNMWKRDSLAVFEKSLDKAHKQTLKDLEQKTGKAEDPKIPNQRNTVFVGPISDYKSEDISKMSPTELIDLLKSWKPKSDVRGFGSSREGLGRELGIAIKSNPLEYSRLSSDFVGIDPTYVRNFLQPFSELAQNTIFLNWEGLVNLCVWVVDQPRDGVVREANNDSFQNDKDWGWTRKAAITLISNGLSSNSIPFELREKVWKVIEVLSDDPDPTSEDEINKDGEVRDDAYGLTINSVRGEAITTVVDYGLWVIRHFEKLPEAERPDGKIFEQFPEMKNMLDKHLDSDTSIAIRAVYGRYLPWLNLFDKEWVNENLKKIFPENGFGSILYDAAWSTYIGYVPVYDDIFTLLRPQYIAAVENIGLAEGKERRVDIDERLAEHIMIEYWRGNLGFEDELFKLFWQKANDETRGHAISFLGRSLQTPEEPLEKEVAERFEKLWDSRLLVFTGNGNTGNYQIEAGAFGWWFSSSKLDENLLFKNFEKTLDHVSEIEADYSVIDRLVILSKSRPLDCIKILTKMIEKNQKQWMLFGNEADIKNILTTTLASTDVMAQKYSKDLANRLVALGHKGYSDLI